MRTTNAVARKKRHNKVLKLAKGYRWGRKKLYRLAKNAVMKAGQHSYKHRRQKKRDFRRLWILRISGALENHSINYSRFQFALTDNKIAINRKMLADLAAQHPEVFSDVVKAVS